MRRMVMVAGCLGLLSLASAEAQGPPISVGVRASTLGLGGELAIGLNDKVEVRGVGNYFSLNRDFDFDTETFGIDLKLQSVGALLDLYAGPLRLTGGGMWNGNKMSGTLTPAGTTVDIGDTTYTLTDIGTVTAGIDFRKFAPYLGIGLGSRGKVGFFFDLGVILSGTPQVTYDYSSLSLTGAAKTKLDAEVNKEIANIQDDLKLFKVYPVVGLGLRFNLK